MIGVLKRVKPPSDTAPRCETNEIGGVEIYVGDELQRTYCRDEITGIRLIVARECGAFLSHREAALHHYRVATAAAASMLSRPMSEFFHGVDLLSIAQNVDVPTERIDCVIGPDSEVEKRVQWCVRRVRRLAIGSTLSWRFEVDPETIRVALLNNSWGLHRTDRDDAFGEKVYGNTSSVDWVATVANEERRGDWRLLDFATEVA